MPVDHLPSTDAQARKKKQLTIVVLLLVGLLAAVVTQPSKEQGDEINSPVATIPKLADRKPQLADADAPREEFMTTRELSKLDLDQMLQASLFFIPEPEVAVVEDVEPQEEVTVQAIYGSGRLTSIANSPSGGELRALIGEAIIRSGEVLPDGRQIVKVSPDGVELTQ